mgnify:CR=1 FL=1
MEPNSLNTEIKKFDNNHQIKNKKTKNDNIPDTNIQLEANENNINNIPEIQPNKFISFITSKLGIAIIASSLVIIAVGIVLGITLSGSKDKDKNQEKLIHSTDEENLKENEGEKNTETENESNNNTEKENDGNTENTENENDNNKENEKENDTNKEETDNKIEKEKSNNIEEEKEKSNNIEEEKEKGNNIEEEKEKSNNTEEKKEKSIEEEKEKNNQNDEEREIENNIEEENDNDYIYKEKILSDTLYVKKVDNLPDDFILGMDLSSVIVEENSGVKYYNFNGEERDIFETLRYVGINYIRVRIWNDPYDSEGHGYGGGNNDMDTAIKIGKRVTKYKMKLLADFHYSDFYADPGQQFVPKAWRGLTLEQKVQKAKEFTIESLTSFKNEGIDVGMVALGNEINDYFCGERTWVNICKILQACTEATRQVLPDTLISVHFTDPNREDSMMYFARNLNENNLDYDVFSVSYYSVWAGGI